MRASAAPVNASVRPPCRADAACRARRRLAVFAHHDDGDGGLRHGREVTRALKFMAAHPATLYAGPRRQRTDDTLERRLPEGRTTRADAGSCAVVRAEAAA